MSFFNPELLAYIIEAYGTPANKEDLRQYMNKLKAFCQSMVVPPMELSSENQTMTIEKRKEIKIKLDLSDRHLQRFRDVKSAVAKVLRVTEVTLCLVSVQEGCTEVCLLYTSPSPRDATLSRMPSSA